MGLTKRRDSYYVEFRVIEMCGRQIVDPGEWRTRCKKETMEGGVPEQNHCSAKWKSR